MLAPKAEHFMMVAFAEASSVSQQQQHHSDDCIFCQIISAAAPAHVVHEDEHTLTIMDAFPSAPGHTLILTKQHFKDIFSASPEAIAAVADHSVALAAAIEAQFQPDGLGIFQLNRAAAGQTVFHYHMHLIPQTEGQAQGIHSKELGDQQQLAAHAKALAARLA